MDKIFAKIIANSNDKGTSIQRQSLINDKFDCEIYFNENKFTNNARLEKENSIIYLFNKKYYDLSNMFENCSLLTSINLSNFNTNNVINMNICLLDAVL